MQDRFRELLAQHERIVVAGGPRTGKTTLVKLVADRPVIHTDDWVGPKKGKPWTAGPRWHAWLGFEDVPHSIAAACPEGPVVIEGVRGIAPLKVGLQVDCVVWLGTPVVQLTPHQEAQRKGRETNLDKWLASGHPGTRVFERWS